MPDESKRPLWKTINPKASSGGKRVNRANSADEVSVFAGEFAMNNPLGTYWPALVQTDELVLSEGSDAEVGGGDYVKITANGDGITVPGAWKRLGTTDIDESNGAVNHIMVLKTVEGIVYTVSLE